MVYLNVVAYLIQSSNNVSSNNKGDGIALSQVTAESVTNVYLWL